MIQNNEEDEFEIVISEDEASQSNIVKKKPKK